jgi:hypothetical protein
MLYSAEQLGRHQPAPPFKGQHKRRPSAICSASGIALIPRCGKRALGPDEDDRVTRLAQGGSWSDPLASGEGFDS